MSTATKISPEQKRKSTKGKDCMSALTVEQKHKANKGKDFVSVLTDKQARQLLRVLITSKEKKYEIDNIQVRELGVQDV